ncbi:MAG: sigma-54-dependent Fis family transcriptional regulator [Tissierellales bacterium]|nr:sigma-54-dependent Fis family transcriptional regulator [Tissierellales bacterium]MBN2827097.1 sigma-54-dependent Fis family transcriptional regulator [Tissierellales bacterium]
MSETGREFILQSNARSEAYGVDRKQVKSKRILDENELRELIHKKQELICIAEPFIKQLYDFVKSSNFIVILNDEEGCILNVIGNTTMLEKAYETGLIPGAYMSEACIGTNGMGTALHERKALQVSGTEHFAEVFHGWTCSGAPIKDHEGNITGCLDLTGDKHLVNSHTLGMVASAAQAIESMLQIKSYTEEIAKNKIYIETMINSLPSSIFTADFEGNIKLVNKYTYSMFGYDEETMKKSKAQHIIVCWDRIIEQIKNKESIFQEDVYVNVPMNKIEVNLSAYPILDPKGNPIEIVFVIKDVKKMRKLANKVMGSRAVYTFDKVIGQDEEFLKIVEFAKKVADSKSTILLMGESGTGKEIFAQSIQNYSNRRKEPFVALNCGAIPKNLIESELFGYVEGAFTGAKQGGHPGKFEIADGGTIFLDEIGEMPFDLQTRLLRVMEESTVRRVGGSEEIPIDVRIIAATNKMLKEEVEKGNFRKDLYYRLNVLPLRLPPLRERKNDIPLFIDYFMEKKSKKLNKKKVTLPKQYLDYLYEYDWPGNIRELENLVELIINTESVPSDFKSKKISMNDKQAYYLNDLTLEELEKIHIEKSLQKYNYNISQVAKSLGISRNSIYRKMLKYNISDSKSNIATK